MKTFLSYTLGLLSPMKSTGQNNLFQIILKSTRMEVDVMPTI